MRLSVDDDLEFGRKIVLFDPFAFEAPQLEIRHPENIVKPATIISNLWQLAHLEFHFGKTLAQRAMHGVSNHAMKSSTMRNADNHILVKDQQTTGIVKHTEVLVGASDKEHPSQSRKDSATPQAPNFSTRNA
jgi:hypothetical protein